MSKSYKPTEAELEILQILWEQGPSSVRQVNEYLKAVKQIEIGYTTTLKTMQIMLDKKLLKRDTSTRTHIYDASVAEQATKKKLLDNFLKSTFKGSASQLVMEALGNHSASEEELEAIKALINKIEKDKK
ncbi:MAG: BlaI/MecI/CopY family transcriptional regulator [Bacteroidota bacterium]